MGYYNFMGNYAFNSTKSIYFHFLVVIPRSNKKQKASPPQNRMPARRLCLLRRTDSWREIQNAGMPFKNYFTSYRLLFSLFNSLTPWHFKCFYQVLYSISTCPLPLEYMPLDMRVVSELYCSINLLTLSFKLAFVLP